MIAEKTLKERIQSFWDFLVLFSGISTASNLSRTRKDPVLHRGLFLFRSRRIKQDPSVGPSGEPEKQADDAN